MEFTNPEREEKKEIRLINSEIYKGGRHRRFEMMCVRLTTQSNPEEFLSCVAFSREEAIERVSRCGRIILWCKEREHIPSPMNLVGKEKPVSYTRKSDR